MNVKRFLSLLLMAALIFTLLPATMLTADELTTYLDKNGEEQSISGALPVTNETSTLDSGWYVVNGDVTITTTVAVTGTVNLILKDEASLTVTGDDNNAGINVSSNNSLTIYAQSFGENTGKLEVTGASPSGAGIGGGNGDDSGNITINGGEVTATSGAYAAGIGGGDGGNNGTVTINNGTINAQGGVSSGAGIGGGANGHGGTVTINGGKINATGGEPNAAGIGGGKDGAGGNITINSGIINAQGGTFGAGIGGGDGGDGGNIAINGGEITATAGNAWAAGIGGGDGGHGGDITIEGGEVTAQGGSFGAGIGGGDGGDGGKITINGGTINATAGNPYGASIGGGNGGSGGIIIINGGEVTATGKGPDSGAGIGSGTNGDSSHITINDGIITAQGGKNSAGINSGNDSTIIINGGSINATGGVNGAGIGGGNGGNGGDITIEGGEVTATGGTRGAGIGGGEGGDGGTVSINDGKITATSGAYGAGIGGGGQDNGTAGDGGNIIINGGTIIAEGETSGAGIGGGGGGYEGTGGNGGNITITDGEVTATGGTCGAGIGGGGGDTGNGGNGGDITIEGGEITAKGGGSHGAGIGGGKNGAGGNITLNNGTINAESMSLGAGIGGGADGDSGTIIINDGIITATAGSGGAGIGSGAGGNSISITVNDGEVTATGGQSGGAGIGGGKNSTGGNITIAGGEITAKGATFGAGIGGGEGGDGGSITINGGTISAESEVYGAGIGGGKDGNGGNIIIKNGAIIATCKNHGGAGIGGGGNSNSGSSGNITIEGGEITAKGATFGAGIGGGHNSNGDSITIKGGLINTTGGTFGAGIGGGGSSEKDSSSSDGGDITIEGGTIKAIAGDGQDGIPGYGIGGGGHYYSTGAAGSSGTCVITGGSVKVEDGIHASPTNQLSIPLHLTTVKLNEIGPATKVDALTANLHGSFYSFGTRDLYPDTNGKLYLYLPEATETTKAKDEKGKLYLGSIETLNDDTAAGILYLVAAPIVNSVTPSATVAPVRGQLVLIFNEGMDSSVPGTVSLGTTVFTGGSWSPDNTTYTINYDGLAAGTTYPITISGFQNIAGSVMEKNTIHSFTTVAASSGSSSKKQTTIIILPEKTPDQPVIASFNTTLTANRDGHATVTISQQTVTEAIAKAHTTAKRQGKTANGIGIAINLNLPTTAQSWHIVLRQGTLEQLINTEVQQLTLNSPFLSLTFDQEALQKIRQESTGNVTIATTPAQGLSAAGKKLIGTRPAYDIVITSIEDNATPNITTLSPGHVVLSLPYTPDANEAVDWLFAVSIDSKGNIARIPGSIYDANSGSLLFSTDHFSIYGVGYTAPSANYTDIVHHWARASIDYEIGRGLFNGISNTLFSPDTDMSRGMLATVLGRLAGADVNEYKQSSFNDVTANKYYLPYVEWANKRGIMEGIGIGQFAPDRAVTREEMALTLQNYAGATGYKLPIIRESITFADSSHIGSTYQSAVTAIQQAGIMVGDTLNQFNPKANTTRAEVAAVLHRYIQLTINPATAQGWAKNDAGQWFYYQDGQAVYGWQTIDSMKYYFYSTGALQTGWVKDGDDWRFYSGNKALLFHHRRHYGNLPLIGMQSILNK